MKYNCFDLSVLSENSGKRCVMVFSKNNFSTFLDYQIILE